MKKQRNALSSFNYWMRMRGGAYLTLLVIAICWLVPVLWMIFASVDGKASAFIKIPDQFTLDNFRTVVSDTSNQRALLNSSVLSIGTAMLVMVASTLAGYALSRFQSSMTRKYVLTVLFLTTLPGTVLIVPVYRMFIVLKLYDSLFGIVLFMSATSLPYSIWLMKIYIDCIPIEMEEAASVDGASYFQQMLHVTVPLVLPGILVVGIRSFSSTWGNFMTPYILLYSPSKIPASSMMYKYTSDYRVSYGHMAAFSVLYSFPTVFLYAFSQRFMSKGQILNGANKG